MEYSCGGRLGEGEGQGGAVHAGPCVQITAEGVWTLFTRPPAAVYGMLHLDASVTWSQVGCFVFVIATIIFHYLSVLPSLLLSVICRFNEGSSCYVPPGQ